MWQGFKPFSFMIEAPGAFVCLGLLLAAMNFFSSWNARRKGGPDAVVVRSECGSCGMCSMAERRG